MTFKQIAHPNLKSLSEECLLANGESDQGQTVARLSTWLSEHPITLDDLPKEALADHHESYARNRLYRCPEIGVVIYLNVWRPGQGSPAHDHGGAWGVVSCLGGRLTLTEYEIMADNQESGRTDLRALPCVDLKPGSMGTTHSPGNEIHSIFNLGSRTAYSLHVYSKEITTYRAFDLERHTFETHNATEV